MAEQQPKENSRKQKKLPIYQDVDGFRLPGGFSAEAFRSAIKYKPRPDDIFVVNYPKCGSTWVQNIVAIIFRNGQPFASALEFFTHTPFLELTGAEGAEKMKRPGALKAHLPFHLMPWSPLAKYIFIARNPKDCCVSFYHHTESLGAYKFKGGEFNDYFELFINGQTDFGDYFDTLLSWYEHRNDPNVLFFTYEQLKKDTKKYVLEIAQFIDPKYREALEKDEELLQNVIKYSSFSYMKESLNKQLSEMDQIPKEELLKNPDLPQGLRAFIASVGQVTSKDESRVHFVRKGIVGDWRNYFTPEQSRRMDEKFKERTKGTDIPKLWEDSMR